MDGAHRHGHGDLGALAAVAAVALAAEVIAALIWWLIAATVVLAVALAAGGFWLHRSARRGERAFAVQLAARQKLRDRPELAPKVGTLGPGNFPRQVTHQHVHFHGVTAEQWAAIRNLADNPAPKEN